MHSPHRFGFAALALLALSACGGSSDKTAPTASATASAPPPPSATASAAPSASAAASAAPSASADADAADDAKPGAVHIHLSGAKVLTGKVDGAEKLLKTDMMKLRTACIAPAVKRAEKGLDGTMKVTLEVEKDGKVGKATSKVTTGKVPEDVEKCTREFYEKKVTFETKAKAKIEATIEVGPKVATDK
ncbi:MAG TPA: hypothetical protein VGM56_32105 [Byssovorax sp.]